ncbi:hypothetical protein WG66_010716 [Moniliophthora roreri]|nr:hypothetical protein WG66_010716 [Moniliophthora roreri]
MIPFPVLPLSPSCRRYFISTPYRIIIYLASGGVLLCQIHRCCRILYFFFCALLNYNVVHAGISGSHPRRLIPSIFLLLCLARL